MALKPNGSSSGLGGDAELRGVQRDLAYEGLLAARSRTAEIAEKHLQSGPLGSRPTVAAAIFPAQTVPVVKGLVDAFGITCQRWHLSVEQQILLLGYKGSEFLGQQLLGGRFLALSQDAKDRTGYVLNISLGLGALFDEAEEAELAWLKLRREELGGMSAIDFILEGRMVNLIIVAAMVDCERGL
jgi:hypothetical protein